MASNIKDIDDILLNFSDEMARRIIQYDRLDTIIHYWYKQDLNQIFMVLSDTIDFNSAIEITDFLKDHGLSSDINEWPDEYKVLLKLTYSGGYK